MSSERQEHSSLHERNKHRSRYDFPSLLIADPSLAEFIFLNKFGVESIDFANPDAVKALNKALLISFYNIQYWDIPEGYLCPPIPGRADYLHYSADLLASFQHNNVPKGRKIKVLDVGVGANCIYPIIGSHEYGWNFVGSEIDQHAIKNAKNIVDANQSLKNKIELRHQHSNDYVFRFLIKKDDVFDLTICNPPFHASAEEASAGSQRKVRNLGGRNYREPVLNFGGKNTELWTTGGELAFISKMIEESKLFQNQCFFFTTLVSKSENLPGIYAMLKRANASDVRVSEMKTGNKITRIVAWTFLDLVQQQTWIKRWAV